MIILSVRYQGLECLVLDQVGSSVLINYGGPKWIGLADTDAWELSW
jgi:hypothetical protein